MGNVQILSTLQNKSMQKKAVHMSSSTVFLAVCSDDGHVEELINSSLLLNPHRLTYELKPDVNFNENLDTYFSSKLKEKEQALTVDEKNNIIKLANDLKQRQEAIDDVNILPKVTISDIPLKREYTEIKISKGNRSIYEVGTNGLIYSDTKFKDYFDRYEITLKKRNQAKIRFESFKAFRDDLRTKVVNEREMAKHNL